MTSELDRLLPELRELIAAVPTAEDPSVAADELYFYLHGRGGTGSKAVDRLAGELMYVLSDFTDLVDSPRTAHRPDLHRWARERLREATQAWLAIHDRPEYWPAFFHDWKDVAHP